MAKLTTDDQRRRVVVYAIAIAAFCGAFRAECQSIHGSLAWYALPIAGDQIATEIALNRGGFETNPTLRGPLSKRVAIATTEAYALAWSDAALCRSGKRKLAWTLRVAAAIFYGRAVVHNVRELKR